MKKKRPRNNICFNNIFYILVLFLFVAFICRFTYLSLSEEVDGINIQEFASNRTKRVDTIHSKRGTIYDVNGEALAQNVYSYTLIAYLSSSRGEGNYVTDKEATAKALSQVINLSEERILELLNKDVYQTEFSNAGKGLTELTKDKIEALNLDGIDFIESQKRYYPKGDFLSYTLGYAKQDAEGTIKGELGLEKLYNKELTGQDGYREYQKDLKGYKIAGTQEIVKDAEDGYDIYLTIDANVQFLLEQAISNIEDQYKFEQLNIVVAEAKTGKILALATSPSFDPNTRNITNYLDPNISVAFEPGSTMKIFSYMAVMEAGKYDGEETFKSGTFVTSDGTELGDWDRDGWGRITYDKGFAMSSNVGVVNLIDKYLSRKELMDYYKKLGFGFKTGIELANETAGKIDFKYETEVFNAGFGQGILTTSIQNVKALTSIANDGILLQPYLIDKIVDSNGNVILQNERTEIERVASKETTDKLKDLMENVIQTGTGSPYKMQGVDLIAKTGTAQIASENGTGYLNGKYDVIRGFAGMYPKDDPDIIIYANVKKLQANSATPLAKLVKEVITNVTKIRNSEIKDDDVQTTNIQLDSYLNKDVNMVATYLTQNEITPIIIGDGTKIIKQYPESKTVVSKNEKVFLLTNSQNIIMPNMKNWSKKEVQTFCNLLDIKAIFQGNGYVESQNIVENTNLKGISSIEFIMKEKYKEEEEEQ